MNCTEHFFPTQMTSYIGMSSVHVCTCGKMVSVALKQRWRTKAEINVYIYI